MKRAKKIAQSALIAVLLWIAISSAIQRFACAKMTATEVFLRIPKSFVCDWEKCK